MSRSPPLPAVLVRRGELTVEQQVGTEYARMLDAVAAGTAGFLWCSAHPAPHVVLGDPLCEVATATTAVEVAPGTE